MSKIEIILQWIFGVLFGLTGIITIFSEPIPGIMLLLIGAVLLPPIIKAISSKFNFAGSKILRTAIIVIAFIVFGATLDTTKSPINNLDTKTETQEATQVNDTESEITPDNTNSDSNQNTEQTETFYTVINVIDGDTIDIAMNGNTEKLRLIGIDTPEVVDPRTTVECFGKEASNKAKELLLNKRVRIENDPSQDTRDRYGRLLVYVWIDNGTFYNKWMVENGYANEYTYNKPYKYQSEFKAAEQAARDNKLGLWNPSVCPTTANTNTNTNSTPTTPVVTPTPNGHIFYTSRYYSSKTYYCDTDPEWKGLSEKYLESYNSEAELLAKYPNKTLNAPCK